MTRHTISLLLILTGMEVGAVVAAVETDLRGEAAMSLTTSDIDPRSLHAAFRYVPELMAAVPLTATREITALASFDFTWQSRIVSFENTSSDSELQTYRLWLRYGARRFEVRVGRQKLSFGSATLLRPLMWFDTVDPRDPLQITDGVDGLLVRHYLLNNGNIWLWGLYGNEDPKGWELVPTTQGTVEFGGRLQWPAGNGEVAFSYHHRHPDFSTLVPQPSPPNITPQAAEDRFALDGKWDVTVGLWFEAVMIHQKHDLLERQYRRLASVGLDYTFGIGQGLTALAEHLILGESAEPFRCTDSSDYSAFSLHYLWGVVDEFRLILYSDWEVPELYSFLEWRRNYDRWSFHLMGFANPEDTGPSLVIPGGDLLAGHGVRILIVLNH